MVAPEEPGGEYVLKITSGLPSGCTWFDACHSSQQGNDYSVEVTNRVPSVTIPCTTVYGYHDGEVVLGSGLKSGETYTVTINADLVISFIARDAGGPAMVEKESPIEGIEVVQTDGGYLLTVISRLPLGSSCSKFNGYEINRLFADWIQVTVTHMEVAEKNVPCTDDYPAVVTEIPLVGDFGGGRTFTVSVNGAEVTFPKAVIPQSGDSDAKEHAATGTHAPIEYATVEVRAPIEGSTIVPPETAGGPYTVKITTGLPSGCAQFSHYYFTLETEGHS